MKKIEGIYSAPRPHWVGDGFPVRSLFSYDRHAQKVSPFLMLDYVEATEFAPGTQRRGVGVHPHRGFETVTIVYQGELEHRDSTGAGGHIGPGDVQWMTAAAGIQHEEFHSTEFTRRGGTLELVQLWVNLPAKDKLGKPGYQTLLDADIPVVPLAAGAGRVRVIAGEYAGRRGPAVTHTPIDVWDIRLNAGQSSTFRVAEGHTLALVVLRGSVQANGQGIAHQSQMLLFDRDGSEIAVAAHGDATLLLLSGQPIDEPIVGYGPFVMNTQQEIQQAIADFRSGKFGGLAA